MYQYIVQFPDSGFIAADSNTVLSAFQTAVMKYGEGNVTALRVLVDDGCYISDKFAFTDAEELKNALLRECEADEVVLIAKAKGWRVCASPFGELSFALTSSEAQETGIELYLCMENALDTKQEHIVSRMIDGLCSVRAAIDERKRSNDFESNEILPPWKQAISAINALIAALSVIEQRDITDGSSEEERQIEDIRKRLAGRGYCSFYDKREETYVIAEPSDDKEFSVLLAVSYPVNESGKDSFVDVMAEAVAQSIERKDQLLTTLDSVAKEENGSQGDSMIATYLIEEIQKERRWLSEIQEEIGRSRTCVA